jgi:hypothetical protein
MTFKRFDVITFDEQDKVVVLEALEYEGEEYVFVNEILPDESDITGVLKVLKVNYDNGTLVLETDKTILNEILPKFKVMLEKEETKE